MSRPTGKSVVVVGSSNTDMILRVARVPRPGETLLGGEFSTAPGGKGANQAVAAARAGGRVSFVARLGRDPLGDAALAGFRKEGMGLSRVVRDRGRPSGVALIFVGADGENSIGVAGGANQRLSPADVSAARGLISGARVLLVQLETPLRTVEAAARIARAAGVDVILNPAPARPLPSALLRNVSILTPNETEASVLTGVRVTGAASAARAARILMRRGVGTVIVTLGARGALVATRGGSQVIPGFKVRAVDTTAAGDVFNGALAVRLAENCPLGAAVRFAHAAAAISVTRRGAQPSIPARSEIDALLGK
ncbi:MAG: ribokinase [Opitutaceae bacterium]|jgi:ribokinase